MPWALEKGLLHVDQTLATGKLLCVFLPDTRAMKAGMWKNEVMVKLAWLQLRVPCRPQLLAWHAVVVDFDVPPLLGLDRDSYPTSVHSVRGHGGAGRLGRAQMTMV